MIAYEDFQKLELKVAKIILAERVEGSEKLLRLEIDLGSPSQISAGEILEGKEKRQIVAGIGLKYSPEELIGREIVVVSNLAPRMLMGLESQGMLLAASDESGPVLLMPDKEVPPGSCVK